MSDLGPGNTWTDSSGQHQDVAPPASPPGTSAANPNGNPATVYSRAQTLADTNAAPLAAQALVNGLSLTANAANTGAILFGGMDAQVSPLAPGQSASISISNANGVYIKGAAGAAVTWFGN